LSADAGGAGVSMDIFALLISAEYVSGNWQAKESFPESKKAAGNK
jgi:hypothetical protein